MLHEHHFLGLDISLQSHNVSSREELDSVLVTQRVITRGAGLCTIFATCCCSVAKSCPTLYDSMDCSTPAFPVVHCLLCHPLLLLPSIFPSIRLFSNASALHIRWPKYWSFSFSISPSSEYSGWFLLGLTGLITLVSKVLSRVFSITTVGKHQFFGAQPSLWSNSHIRIWLLEKPQLWLFGPLSAKWCLCFLICCLGLS